MHVTSKSKRKEARKIAISEKLTEDTAVLLLKDYLETLGWDISDRYCLGAKRGWDLEAHKGETVLLVEVKGARAGDEAKTKKKEFFNSGQIKTHLGKALVTMLEAKIKHPRAELAIAHPDDPDIRRVIGPVIPHLRDLGIRHFWVGQNAVAEEY